MIWRSVIGLPTLAAPPAKDLQQSCLLLVTSPAGRQARATQDLVLNRDKEGFSGHKSFTQPTLLLPQHGLPYNPLVCADINCTCQQLAVNLCMSYSPCPAHPAIAWLIFFAA
jgi:hypothetical protein